MRRERALLAGLAAYYGLVAGGFLYATLGAHLARWPFARASSTTDALVSVAVYIPVLALSLASLLFVRASKAEIAPLFAKPRIDAAASALMAACALYALFMLSRHPA